LSAGVLVLAAACRRPENSGAAVSAAPTVVPYAPATAPAPASAVPTPDKLIGRWARSDADYTIEIAAVAPDGKLEVRYLNPKPIHVSRAEAVVAHDALNVLVELQDKGYPGNYYVLSYDPGSDSLSGVYNHLGLNQQFEVVFSRISATTR
jgi:hypothetical protein